MNRFSVLICLLFSFLTSAHLQAQKAFEGEIVYAITYEPIQKDFDTGFLQKEYGDTLIALIKEDKYVMFQNSSGPMGLSKIVYLLDKKMAYMDYEKSDTIISLATDGKGAELFRFERDAETKKEVLDKSCESILIEYKPATNYVDKISTRLFFHPDYALNPEKYASLSSDFLHRYAAEAKALSLRVETTYGTYYRAINHAVSITPRTIDESEFELDPGKAIVKIR
ncbi:MAG: hypothetical protein AAF206_01370 [Bacteroidota bacterium]